MHRGHRGEDFGFSTPRTALLALPAQPLRQLQPCPSFTNPATTSLGARDQTSQYFLLCHKFSFHTLALKCSFLVNDDTVQWCLLSYLPYLTGRESVSMTSRLPIPAWLLPPNCLFLAMHAAALYRPLSTFRGMRIRPKPWAFFSC